MADVVSLYPNVDTKKALIALDLLLKEARVRKTPLLIQFARLVFDNNYLSSEFSPDIFHQVFGIAMGMPFAVMVANAFLFHHKKDIVEYYSQYLNLLTPVPPVTNLGLSSSSDVIIFYQNWHLLYSTSAAGRDLSNDAQIRVIGRMEP